MFCTVELGRVFDISEVSTFSGAAATGIYTKEPVYFIFILYKIFTNISMTNSNTQNKVEKYCLD